MEHEWDFIFHKSNGSEAWKRGQMDAMKARTEKNRRARRGEGEESAVREQSASGPQLSKAAEAMAERRAEGTSGAASGVGARRPEKEGTSSVVPYPPYAN